MPMYDYVCPQGHRSEHFVRMDEAKKAQPCTTCGEPSSRVPSVPHFPISMGVDPDLPTMADRWARYHELGAQTESKEDL